MTNFFNSKEDYRAAQKLIGREKIASMLFWATRRTRTGPEVARIHHTITDRAACWAEISRYAECGQVGVIRHGRDCDCVEYHDEYVREMPKGAFKWHRDLREDEEYLDGPCSVRYVPASSINEPVHTTRDLALEAFEDGHPHVVYASAI